MGRWEDAYWDGDPHAPAPRRDRLSGAYQCYVPDLLVGMPLVLSRTTDALISECERRVRGVRGSTSDLAGISRFLLRSEAIASSRIEGIAPSARQVALAELGQTEDVRGVSDQAHLVANNMTVVREATTRLVAIDHVTVGDIAELHASLLPEETHHHGIRLVQNWIGGSDWHPIGADFVPPPAELVPDLMADLTTYLAGGLHSPVVQSALVHAQFETIHPFTDGNGRVGRALIHTVLARRGMVNDALLPISLVLSTLRDRYIAGLTAYRSAVDPLSPDAMAARDQWIATFAEVTILACDQAERIADELADVRADWLSRLDASRRERGSTRALRSDSATALILADLPATPVLTPATVQRIHGVSHVAANKALDELADAGILNTRNIAPGRRAFVADDVLDLITWAERRLASTRFDTRQVQPHPGVAAAPEKGRLSE